MKIRTLLIALAFFSIPCFGQNFMTVTASHIYGTGSSLLSSGTLVWQAVDSNGNPVGYQVGGGGQQITFPTICSIVNGAISGGCQLPNVSLTNPMNVCFALTIKGSANQILSPASNGRSCLQPQTTNSWCSAGTCNLDQFTPVNPSVVTALLNSPQVLSLGGIYSKSCSVSGTVVIGYDTTGNPICAPGTGGVAGINTANGSGLSGGGSSGTLNLTLITTCNPNQILQWSGSVWACANESGGGGSVDSVFGRTGVVTAQSGDYAVGQVTGAVANTTTINGHSLSSNVTISASDLTTGTLPHAQLPALLSSDIPNNNAIAGGVKVGGVILGLADGCLFTVATVVTSTGAPCGAGGAVASVFGRTGVVVATSGDYTAAQVTGAVPNTTTVNGHALSANVVVSASDLTTGTLPHAQLPTLLSGDIPNNAANTTGTSGGLKVGGTIAGLADGCLNIASTVVGSTGAPCGSGSGGVTSFNGRVGAVVPASGDYTASQVTGAVPNTITVNTHPLSSNVVVSASDLTTGTLPHAQLPALLSADIPNNAANTSGTAGGLSANIAESQVTNLVSDLAGKVPTTTTVNGHALSGNVTVTATDVGLGSVTNDAQTKAAVMPNTLPPAGKIPVGNAGGTAYAPVAVSGDCTLASTGAITCTSTGGTAFAATATNAAAATGLNGASIPLSKTIVGTNGSGQIIDASSATLSNTTTGKAAGLSASGTLTGLSNGCLNVASNVIGSTGSACATFPPAGIPNSTGSGYGTSYSTTGTGTVVALSASPALTGLPTITGADFGASPTPNSVLNITTVSTTNTDFSYLFGIDDPTTTYNNPFYVNVDGFSQLQVCNNGSSHIGGVLIGNFQATPKQSCQLLTSSPFNKLTVINNSNNRTEIALVHTNTTGGSGNVMQRFLSGAAVGTGLLFFNTCAGTTAIDGTCNGTVLSSLDDSGNFNTAGAITQTGTGPTQKSGKEVAGTSVTVPAGYDFSYFIGNDNLFHCQLSTGLGGGSCNSGGLSDPGSNGVLKRTALNVTATAGFADIVALFGSGSCSGFLKNDGTCASGGAVTSVFGRTGAVTATSGDYTQPQITPTVPTAVLSTNTPATSVFQTGCSFFADNLTTGTPSFTLPSSVPPAGGCIIIANFGTVPLTISPNGLLMNGSSSSETLIAGATNLPSGVLISSLGPSSPQGAYSAVFFNLPPITAIQNGGAAVTPTSGAVNFVAGSNVSIITSGNSMTFASSAGGAGSNWYGYGTDSGAANAYVVTSTMISYAAGNVECFSPLHNNTGSAPTVNFNSLGTKTIVRFFGIILASSDMTAGVPSCLLYTGTQFLLLNPNAKTGSASQVLSTNPTLTNPQIGNIEDANGAPFIQSSSTASAVDSYTITNSATANPATVALTATGSDANINNNIVSTGTGNVEANGNVVCAGGPFTALTDGTTVTWTTVGGCDNASLTFTTHGGSRTLNITPLSGGHYKLILHQDATGGESLSGGTGCTWKQKGGGGSTFTLTNSANAIDILTFDYDGTNCYADLNLAYN